MPVGEGRISIATVTTAVSDIEVRLVWYVVLKHVNNMDETSIVFIAVSCLLDTALRVGYKYDNAE